MTLAQLLELENKRMEAQVGPTAAWCTLLEAGMCRPCCRSSPASCSRPALLALPAWTWPFSSWAGAARIVWLERTRRLLVWG